LFPLDIKADVTKSWACLLDGFEVLWYRDDLFEGIDKGAEGLELLFKE
jgi:hypothetical protein